MTKPLFLSHSKRDDDHAILCHPYMLMSNGTLVYRLLEYLRIPCDGKTVLDLGAGTGQATRLLKAIPGLRVEACDIDPSSERFFREHAELRDVPFFQLDFLTQDIPKHYDAIICRGVYHHVPKRLRSTFLRQIYDHSSVAIIVDEGILEYSTIQEREAHCDSWYGHIVREAERQRLHYLARAETEFWKHERLNSADDGGDFKESPSHLIVDAEAAGLAPVSLDRYGPWHLGGGFFTVTFAHPHHS
jgi:SAM-dependent methyltransferase